jgi:hypothetical protein
MPQRQALLNHCAAWPFALFGLNPLFPFTARPIGSPTVIIHELLVALGNMPNQIQQKQQGRPDPLVFSIFVMIFAGSIAHLALARHTPRTLQFLGIFIFWRTNARFVD